MKNYVCLDGEIIEEGTVSFPLGNRAFQYGDSLFETMVAFDAQILRASLHWARLTRGMEVLSYHAPCSQEHFFSLIQQLLEKQQLSKGYARVRCQCWRQTGGLYTPTQTNIHWLIQVSECSIKTPQRYHAGISQQVQLAPTLPLSSLKTGSALPYILAGIERKAHQWDEIILLNTQKQVVEAGASNIFWLKGDTIFTPSLQSGCLAGVTRQYLLNYWKAKGIKVQEGLYSLVELYEASHIFTSNAAGLHHIISIDEHYFTAWGVLESLQASIFQP